MTQAFAYLRTSSLTNVGGDKDSDSRQRDNIEAYANRVGVDVIEEFYDAAVKGSEPVHTRPGFADMLARIAGNGVRMVLVESASRFARDLIIQETGYAYLKKLGITLIAVDDPDSFTADTPTARLVRQVLGAVAEFEKANLVAKLKRARDKKRERTGRCEGRKQAPEEARALAVELHSGDNSLRRIAGELALRGFRGPSGKPYGPESIKAMVATNRAPK